MNFYDEVGPMALGSRLRRLSEQITGESAQLYALYGVELEPKWFPVFYLLSANNEKTITEIAEEIGHSHPSVSRIVREMVKQGCVVERNSDRDGRKTIVALSARGQAIAEKIKNQYADVRHAIECTRSEAQHDLWQALAEWEYLLQQKSLVQRVQEARKQRESAKVRIVDYESRHRDAFRQLNEEWITRYFRLEETDRKALENPDTYILKRGGHIFIALSGHEPVGVCALLKLNEASYELAKMAVSPRAQGKGIGHLLGRAAIERARSIGAAGVYLETNLALTPAIQLYHKLGFKKVIGPASPYARSNLQMELPLKPDWTMAVAASRREAS